MVRTDKDGAQLEVLEQREQASLLKEETQFVQAALRIVAKHQGKILRDMSAVPWFDFKEFAIPDEVARPLADPMINMSRALLLGLLKIPNNGIDDYVSSDKPRIIIKGSTETAEMDGECILVEITQVPTQLEVLADIGGGRTPVQVQKHTATLIIPMVEFRNTTNCCQDPARVILNHTLHLESPDFSLEVYVENGNVTGFHGYDLRFGKDYMYYGLGRFFEGGVPLAEFDLKEEIVHSLKKHRPL